MIFCSKHYMGSALVQNSKINCLMALWRCQRLHWNWYDLYLPSKNIHFLKFYCWKSNSSLHHWEDNVYLRDLFLSNWCLFSTFSWGNTMKTPNIFRGFTPNPTRTLSWTRWGGSQSSPSPPNPQLIIAIYPLQIF